MHKRLLTLLLFFSLFLNVYGQNRSEEMIGHVINALTNEGLEGVKVQLIATGDIQYTDSEGKFRFVNKKGFVIGEPNYAFTLFKEGYLTIGTTNNVVVFGSGAINNLAMKPDLDKFLWITVKDAITNNFIENVSIDIKGKIAVTNARGRAKFDFSEYGEGKLKAYITANCYQDRSIELDVKGEEEVLLTYRCSRAEKKETYSRTIDATQILDRALQSKNGSKQGQVKAIQFLRAQGHDFNSTDFQGVWLEKLVLKETNLSNTNFDFANLSNADFYKSNLFKSRFNIAIAVETDFNAANLSYTRAGFLDAKKANFTNADLSYSYFTGADFSDADFSHANLEGALFAFCNFTNAKFNNATLTNAGLVGSVLNNTLFNNAVVSNTSIEGSVTNDGSFNMFSKEQKVGLCKYVDSNRYLGLGGIKTEFKFELTEDTHSSYRRYDEVVREYYRFEGFGGGNCKVCNTRAWEKDKWRDYYSYYTIIKDREFLRKNDRISYTRKFVKNH